jgi:hypothetical protein
MAEYTISDREPPSMTSKVCLRSPPKTTTFPPKGFFLFVDDGNGNRSQSVLSRDQKQFCVIKASSHIMRDAACISSHNIVPRFMLHVVVSSKLSHGILK